MPAISYHKRNVWKGFKITFEKNNLDEDASSYNENYFVLRNKADGLAGSEIFILFASAAYEFNLP